MRRGRRLLILPATFLQVGLRDASEPWYHVNDSTYQIEIAGDLILDGENPYGHDYRDSGLERWYPAAQPNARIPQVALDHFAYFPGTALTAAAWRFLPEPFDDYRCSSCSARSASSAPRCCSTHRSTGARRRRRTRRQPAGGDRGVVRDRRRAVPAADRAGVRLRGETRYLAAAACIAGAILLKQFALIALPFLAVMMLTRGAPRRVLWQAGALFAGIVALGILPFAIWDPGALWDDTIAYGAQTYRIIGHGLAGVLLEIGVLDDRFGPYPFRSPRCSATGHGVAFVEWRARRLWIGAAAFGASIFGLLTLAAFSRTRT